MAEPTQDGNANFDRQNQWERSENLSLETHETDQQSCDNSGAASSTVRNVLYPQLYTESTTESGRAGDYRRLEANSAKNVLIPQYILVILVVAVAVTLLVCVTLLMIILLTKMPQNISDAAKEGHLVAKTLKDLNMSESNLISAAIFLHELIETREEVTALRKDITANGKVVLSKLQKPLKEIRDEMKAMRENLTITEELSDVLFARISKPLSELSEDIRTLKKHITMAQSKDDVCLANITNDMKGFKEDMREIKQKLNSRATLTESSFFSCVNVISFLLISIWFCMN